MLKSSQVVPRVVFRQLLYDRLVYFYMQLLRSMQLVSDAVIKISRDSPARVGWAKPGNAALPTRIGTAGCDDLRLGHGGSAPMPCGLLSPEVVLSFARFGAPGRTRTSTGVSPPDFESGASTSSATGARRGGI